LDVTLYDVGDGEAILVRRVNRGVFIDGGSGSKTNDNAQDARRLFAKFPSDLKLDAVIASHPHRDHTNFYPCLVRDFPGLLRHGAVSTTMGRSRRTTTGRPLTERRAPRSVCPASPSRAARRSERRGSVPC